MSDATRDPLDAEREDPAPWDTGVPQPEVVRLAEEGAFRGSVLEVGCGAGENALFLAARGLAVLGVDGAPAAVERARQEAARRGLQVRFARADPLDLDALRERFETALDARLFHLLDDADRKRYAESVAAALGPGAHLHLLCVSEEEPPGWGPRRVAEWDLRATFRGLFAVTALRTALIALRPPRDTARAWLATLTRV